MALYPGLHDLERGYVERTPPAYSVEAGRAKYTGPPPLSVREWTRNALPAFVQSLPGEVGRFQLTCSADGGDGLAQTADLAPPEHRP